MKEKSKKIYIILIFFSAVEIGVNKLRSKKGKNRENKAFHSWSDLLKLINLTDLLKYKMEKVRRQHLKDKIASRCGSR